MQNLEENRLLRMYVMEAVGSFIIHAVIQLAHIFVFSAFAISLAFIVAVVTAAKISGANLNGAVTVTLALNQTRSERSSMKHPEKIVKYILAQVAGGILAGVLIAIIHGPSKLVEIQPSPSITLTQAFILEFIYTLTLCSVVGILCSDVYRQAHDPAIVGSLVAACVFLASMALGDKTGGVINPSVALSAMLARMITNFSGLNLKLLILYIAAHLLAALVSHILYDKIIRPAFLKQLPGKSRSEMLMKTMRGEE